MGGNKKGGKNKQKKVQQVPKKSKKNQKKIKIKLKEVFLSLLIIIVVVLVGKYIYDMPVKNIIVMGNYYLTDQEIIDIAELREYPSTLANSSYVLEKRIEEEDLVQNVKISKKNFLSKVIIEIDENRPLFYYQPEGKVVLEDGTMVNIDISVPILVNQVPDTIYEELIEDMSGVPLSVLDKMSEIKYVPTNVDPELFIITMNDGIYVYVTLAKFERIYNYIEYAEGFEQNKGILHLDSGDYLEIIKEK